MRKSVSTYVPAPEGGGDIQGEYRDKERKEQRNQRAGVFSPCNSPRRMKNQSPER